MPSLRAWACPLIAASGVRSSWETDVRNSRCRSSLCCSASANSFTAVATSATSLGPATGARVCRDPAPIARAVSAVRRSGRVTSRAITRPPITAATSPMASASNTLRCNDFCVPAPMSADATRAKPRSAAAPGLQQFGATGHRERPRHGLRRRRDRATPAAAASLTAAASAPARVPVLPDGHHRDALLGEDLGEFGQPDPVARDPRR